MGLREDLARLEHEQWVAWAETLIETENLSEDRVNRWKQYFVPYDELDEPVKSFDRVWADKVIEILKIYGLY